MLLVTVLLWALNLTVTRYVLTHGFRPLAFASVRYGSAAAIFATVTYGRERSLAIGRGRPWLLVGAAGLLIWLNQTSFVYAIKLSTATTVALVLGVTPTFAALFAFLVGLERVSQRFAVAAAVSFGGVALVALGSGGGLSASVAGDAIAVATAATWAGYSVLIASLMRLYSPFRISAVVFLIGLGPLLATGARQVAEQDFGAISATAWALLAYSTLGPLVLTNLLWYKALARVGPSRATLFANIQPFFAAIFALLLLSESLSGIQIAGGVAIAGGIALARRRWVAVPVAPE